MPESTVFVLDTSEHMRNGDYEPTRLESQHQAARMMVDIKLSASPENTVGFVSTGPTVVVRAPTTNDAAMLSSAIDGLRPAGKADFVAAVKTASLALHNRANKLGQGKVVAFVGSPVTATDAELKKMAAGIRKLNVAVDVVVVGEQASSLAKLELFVAKMNANRDNCSLISAPPKSNLTDILMSSMFTGGGGGGGSAAATASAGGGGGGGSTEDDMLAMALRQSLAMAQEEGARAGGETGGGGGGASRGLPADINVALLEANGIDLNQDVEMLRVLQSSLNEAFGITSDAAAPADSSAAAAGEGSGAAGPLVPSPGGGDEAGEGGADDEDDDGGFDEADLMEIMEGLDTSDPAIAASLQAIMEAQMDVDDDEEDGEEDGEEGDDDEDAEGGDGSGTGAKRPKPEGGAE